MLSLLADEQSQDKSGQQAEAQDHEHPAEAAAAPEHRGAAEEAGRDQPPVQQPAGGLQ